MSQMKPYCFKCGAELDPDAIYCPECGRLQRSMVVRAVDPNVPSRPAAPNPGSSHDQPYQFYPGREGGGAEHTEQQHPDAAPQHPDQPDPYAQQYSEHDWRGGQTNDGYGEQTPYPAQGGDQVYAQHDNEHQPYGDQSWYRPDQGSETGAYDGQERQDPAYGQHDQGYGQQDPAYGQQYAQHDPAYGQQDPAYDQQQYAQHDPAYGQQDPAYDQQYAQHDPAYGQQDPAYDQQDPAYDQQYAQHDPAYGQHDQAYDQQQYAQHDPAYGQQDPAYDQQQYAQHDPAYDHQYEQPEPGPEPSYTPPAPIYQRAPTAPVAPEPAQQPAEPVYRSSAPIPAGSIEPFDVPPPPTGGFGPPTSAPPAPPLPPAPVGAARYGSSRSSNPYALATYGPDATYGQPGGGRRPFRLLAIGGVILLGLFLIAFAAGQLLGGRGTPTASTGGQPTTAPSTQPSTAPTATSAPTATPTQGITGSAKFVRVNSDIPGRCTIANGCPVEGTFKNTGGQGSGSVTFNLTDQGGGTVYGTCTTQIPSTDAGQTATATCNANGDALGQLFHSNPNATVYLQTVINGS
jgi:zinc-ribbon domain